MQNQNESVQKVSIALIDLNTDQSRIVYDDESLNELASSISSIGLLNPISLLEKDGRYKLLAGSRRLKACHLLQHNFIRATIHSGDDVQELSIMAHENLFRADLSPMEEATFYQRLMAEKKMTVEQLIHLTKKPASYVQARIGLLNCSDKLQAYVHGGELKISAALILNKFPTQESRDQYTEYAVSTGASIQTIRYWLQQVETAGCAPSTGDIPPAPAPGQPQSSIFGWDCYSCGSFTPAPNCVTIHLCEPCLATAEKAKKNG